MTAVNEVDTGAGTGVFEDGEIDWSKIKEGTKEWKKVTKRLANAYGALAVSIAMSTSDSGWTGWNWRENDRN